MTSQMVLSAVEKEIQIKRRRECWEKTLLYSSEQKRGHLSPDLKKSRRFLGGRTFQAEGTACVKALGQTKAS